MTDEQNREPYFEYLDALRETNVTNMFGARPYLQKEFPELYKDTSSKILREWMDTFAERQNKSSLGR